MISRFTVSKVVRSLVPIFLGHLCRQSSTFMLQIPYRARRIFIQIQTRPAFQLIQRAVKPMGL